MVKGFSNRKNSTQCGRRCKKRHPSQIALLKQNETKKWKSKCWMNDVVLNNSVFNYEF